MDFKDVVKAHPITPAAASTPAALSGKLGAIDGAAGKLASAAYPLVKDVDWTSDLALKPLPGVSPNQALKAIDKALVMGASMDGKLLKEAAEAHHKAIGSVDGKIVSPVVPNFLYSTVNPGDAQAAYAALLNFKDV